MELNLYKDYIIEVPNFPIKGVNFKDISPLLSDHRTFRSAVADMGRLVKNPDYWVGIDSRGYLFSSALATQFGGGIICFHSSSTLSSFQFFLNMLINPSSSFVFSSFWVYLI